MSTTLYRCRECFERGKERTFRTPSGYKNHLNNYHTAKKTDLVNVIKVGPDGRQ